MNSNSKKIIAIIIFIILSTLVGYYDRFTPKKLSTSTVNVIQKASIMIIPIEGTIIDSGTEWAPSIVDTISSQLKIAEKSKHIKGVVLKINSPGGTIAASQDIYYALRRFKEKTKKPVVVSIMDIGASGGYWIALASDYIFSYPGSIVGSIGVITQTMNLTNVPKKYGINVRTYKSGPHKDLLNAWRNPTKDDIWLIQKMLDTVHKQFKSVLIANRKISQRKADIMADGRIYAGEDALTHGLIDQLGSLHDAIQYTAKLCNITNEPNIVYPNRGVKDWIQSFRAILQPSSIINHHLLSQPQFIR